MPDLPSYVERNIHEIGGERAKLCLRTLGNIRSGCVSAEKLGEAQFSARSIVTNQGIYSGQTAAQADIQMTRLTRRQVS